MRKLEIGQAVRVSHTARIVGQPDKDNMFWWEVEYPTGERAIVSLARLDPIVDTPKMMIDHDSSIAIWSTRLSAEGALDLLLWLETHRHEFEAVTRVTEENISSVLTEHGQ